jgi:hypothetical protein
MKSLLRNMTPGVFNARYPPGSRFRYWLIPGVSDAEEVVTRSEAWTTRAGRLMVRVEGKPGGVSVSHLAPYA